MHLATEKCLGEDEISNKEKLLYKCVSESMEAQICKIVIVTPQVFQGPLSPTEEKQLIFDQPIEMRLLRLKPTNWYQAIAVRLEVIGCELPMVPTTTTTTGEWASWY